MQNISNDQMQFLKSVATIAYGSGKNEGVTGGKGHMALLTGADGKVRVIKCNTHFSHAQKVQNEINATQLLQGQRKDLLEGSKLLREKLVEIGKSLGMGEDDLGNIFGKGDLGKTLLTRQVVAKFVTSAQGKANHQLDSIWKDASKNAVTSDFSMTYEKVTGKGATDFHGDISVQKRQEYVTKLETLNTSLGLDDGTVYPKGDGNPILSMITKLKDKKLPLLTVEDERTLQRFEALAQNLNNGGVEKPFGKANMYSLLCQEFDEYGEVASEMEFASLFKEGGLDKLIDGFLKGDITGDIQENLSSKVKQYTTNVMVDVFKEYVQKGLENNLGDICPTLKDFVDGPDGASRFKGFMKMMHKPEVQRDAGLDELVSEDNYKDVSVFLMDYAETELKGLNVDEQNEIVANVRDDPSFIKGMKDLLCGQKEVHGYTDFESLARGFLRGKVLAPAEEKLTKAIGKNGGTCKLILESLATKNMKGFLDACEMLAFDISKSEALGSNAKGLRNVLEAANEYLKASNAVSGTNYVMKPSRQYFSEVILEKCDQICGQLKKDGLQKTSEQFAKLLQNVRENRSKQTLMDLQKFVLRLAKIGHCADPDVAAQVSRNTKNSEKTFEASVVEKHMREVAISITADEIKYLEATMQQKVAALLDESLASGNKKDVEGIMKELNTTCCVGGSIMPDVHELLKQRDQEIMDSITDYGDVLGKLTKDSKAGLPMIMKDGGTLEFEDNDKKLVQYKRTNVEPGRVYPHKGSIRLDMKSAEQSCLFHSLLNSMGYDVTRENGLRLRKALSLYVQTCIDKAGAKETKKLVNEGSMLSAYMEKISGKATDNIAYEFTTIPEDFKHYDDVPGAIRKPTLAMDGGFVPFLASMLKRPINLIMLDNGYQHIGSYNYDMDIMNGEKIESKEPPLTIMIAADHYQSLTSPNA